MKKLFVKVKLIQIAALVTIFSLLPIVVFCAPEKRTYVGWDNRNEIRIPHEIAKTIELYEQVTEEAESVEQMAETDFTSEQVQNKDLSREIAFVRDIPTALGSSSNDEEQIEISSTVQSGAVSKKQDIRTETEIDNSIVLENIQPVQPQTQNVVTNADIVRYYEINKEYFKK